MEPLWSPVVATGRKRSQIRHAQKPRKQAKTVAVGCDRLPETSDGKEGVDGSSPSEGLQERRTPRFLGQADLLCVELVVGMEPFMELSRSQVQPGARGFAIGPSRSSRYLRGGATICLDDGAAGGGVASRGSMPKRCS